MQTILHETAQRTGRGDQNEARGKVDELQTRASRHTDSREAKGGNHRDIYLKYVPAINWGPADNRRKGGKRETRQEEKTQEERKSNSTQLLSGSQEIYVRGKGSWIDTQRTRTSSCENTMVAGGPAASKGNWLDAWSE